MTLITFQDGSPILKDGKIGTEQACCCGGGACCIPELEPCVYVTGPCPEEGDCGDGFICNDDGNCQGFGDFPIGECPGAVIGDPVPAECQDGLTQSECEATYGTYHPDKTCEQVCCGACDEENPCPEGCACVDGECVPASGACDTADCNPLP